MREVLGSLPRTALCDAALKHCGRSCQTIAEPSFDPGTFGLWAQELPSSVWTAGPQRPDRMPEGMPDRMSDKMSDRMPQDMPDRIPEDLSDNMPEDMSDRMPEDLPVTKCINVMVGITRSKVFFFGAGN